MSAGILVGCRSSGLSGRWTGGSRRQGLADGAEEDAQPTDVVLVRLEGSSCLHIATERFQDSRYGQLTGLMQIAEGQLVFDPTFFVFGDPAATGR